VRNPQYDRLRACASSVPLLVTLGNSDLSAGTQAAYDHELRETVISPGETLRFELLFETLGVGLAEIRITHGLDAIMFSSTIMVNIAFPKSGAEERFQTNRFLLDVEAGGIHVADFRRDFPPHTSADEEIGQ
jgi:hypothetical protein